MGYGGALGDVQNATRPLGVQNSNGRLPGCSPPGGQEGLPHYIPPVICPLPAQALLELSELLAAHNNYARYRRTWADCTGFRLPVLGVHLKDLVSLHEAQPDRLPDGRLHLPKLNNLYLRLQELAALQRQHPPCGASEDLLHLLTVSCPPRPACAPGDPACRLRTFPVLGAGRPASLLCPLHRLGN